MVAPSLYPKSSIKSNCTDVSCNKCDICKNFLIADSKFRCTVTGKTYFTKGNLSCNFPLAGNEQWYQKYCQNLRNMSAIHKRKWREPFIPHEILDIPWTKVGTD